MAGSASLCNRQQWTLKVEEVDAGKHIVITGGSSGIGSAIARDFGCDGSGNQIFVTGRSADELKKVVDDIQAKGGSAAFGVGDVTSEEDVRRLHDEAKAFMGHIDVLVANAGCGGGRALLEKVELDKFERQFDTNVKGVFLWIKELLPDMKARQSGQIVVTSSVAGKKPFAQGSIYCASKWAVEGMVLSLREELAGTGVKAATINPGPVDTKWWSDPARCGRYSQLVVSCAHL
jgi:NAD(P)-dependent dehydrogenase (short-subunit alcohol dehydrogenase family)